MPQPKFQLYKHIKINGKWRYCRAAIYSNGKVKPHVIVVGNRMRSTKKALTASATKSLGLMLTPIRSQRSGCAASSLTKPNTQRCSQ